MKQYFSIASQAAFAAGNYIQQSVRDLTEIDYKGRADLVTNVDRTAENIIVEHIRQSFPDHGILAEESEQDQLNNEFLWIIDPLDGTTNFVHGYPHYAVSIALQINGSTELGLVHNPADNEIYSAIRGQGAFLNKEQIQVSGISNLNQSLLITGIPYEITDRWHTSMDLFKLFYAQSHGVRRDGSAALDLCYVAAGRFDGFWEFDLHPWDVAAGILIVEEAGGQVTRFDGSESSVFDNEFLASNGKIHDAMVEVIGAVPY